MSSDTEEAKNNAMSSSDVEEATDGADSDSLLTELADDQFDFEGKEDPAFRECLEKSRLALNPSNELEQKLIEIVAICEWYAHRIKKIQDNTCTTLETNTGTPEHHPHNTSAELTNEKAHYRIIQRRAFLLVNALQELRRQAEDEFYRPPLPHPSLVAVNPVLAYDPDRRADLQNEAKLSAEMLVSRFFSNTAEAPPEQDPPLRKPTHKQVEANRQNALRSTGPRSLPGKRRSRMNALRHGLCAEAVIVPDEDPAEFTRFVERLRAEIQPKGIREEHLLDQIALFTWRSRRYSAMEAALLRANVLRAKHKHLTAVPSRRKIPFADECTRAEWQHCRRVERVEGQLEVHEISTTAAFAADAAGPDFLDKVNRYERYNQRALERAWRELERLQEERLRREGSKSENSSSSPNDEE